MISSSTGLIRKKNSLVKILANGEFSQSINVKADKASKSAVKIISEKKGNITFYEKKEVLVKKEKDIKKNKDKVTE